MSSAGLVVARVGAAQSDVVDLGRAYRFEGVGDGRRDVVVADLRY